MKLPEWTHSIQFRLVLGFAALLATCLFAVSVWATYSTRIAIREYGQNVERFEEEKARKLLQEIFVYNADLAQLQNSVQQIGRFMELRVAVVDPQGFVVADSHEFPTNFEGKYQKQDERFDKKFALRTMPITLGNEFTGKVIFSEQGRKNRFPLRFRLGAEDQPLPYPKDESQPIKLPESNSVVLDKSKLFAETLAVQDHFEARSDDAADAVVLISDAVDELSVEPQLSALQNEFQKSLLISGIAAGIAGILIIAFFTRRAFAPMQDLTVAAGRLGRGELDQRVQTSHRGEIGQLATTFNAMAYELESAETRRRRLTADIAHELRTPLTNIRGYLEAIKDGVVEPEDQTIETLHQETLHLSRLVEDVRILAVADAGALKLNMHADRVETVVQNVVRAFKPRAIESGVQIVCEIPEVVPLVDIDRTRMTQVVHNLVENAIAHSPPGAEVGVRICVTDDANHVRISITDQGDGIPDDEIDRIFDQFYRVDVSRARSTGGAGLGLTIAKRLVEAHDGHINADSAPNQGSTFTITLPTSQTHAD
ncbi:MAG: HAMP domain-containing sensor histidine kinase [Chloroflexi bacterium]|nr:HAMP domain-containing sensor histidine kinase [Chloroflexota bacterium]